ncbi:hypothetical protein [Rhodoplanes sp. SY1]|uniref:hypothetical protein n=1 Tax=Rhodoplanes sp. SY1 TaxID=3166646 RepID=UPI0038B62099
MPKLTTSAAGGAMPAARAATTSEASSSGGAVALAVDPTDDRLIELGAELWRRSYAVMEATSDDEHDAALERVSEITAAIRAIPPRDIPGLLVWLRATAAELQLLIGIEGPVGPMNWPQKVFRHLVDAVAAMGAVTRPENDPLGILDTDSETDETARREAEIEVRRERLARGEVTPFDVACRMEDDVTCVSDFATVLAMMASGNDLEGDVVAAFDRVARALKSTSERLQEARGELFRMLSPYATREQVAEVGDAG